MAATDGLAEPKGNGISLHDLGRTGTDSTRKDAACLALTSACLDVTTADATHHVDGSTGGHSSSRRASPKGAATTKRCLTSTANAFISLASFRLTPVLVTTDGLLTRRGPRVAAVVTVATKGKVACVCLALTYATSKVTVATPF